MIKKIIIITIVIILPLAAVYIINKSINTASEEYKKEAESAVQLYQNKIDSILKNQKQYDLKIQELEIIDSQLTSTVKNNYFLIEKNNKELLKFKNLYNEKINSISNYTYNQLDSFFTERYK